MNSSGPALIIHSFFTVTYCEELMGKYIYLYLSIYVCVYLYIYLSISDT